jgi:hypothetical protein
VIKSIQTLTALLARNADFLYIIVLGNHAMYMEEKKKLKMQGFLNIPNICRPLMRGIEAIKENNASLKLYSVSPAVTRSSATN